MPHSNYDDIFVEEVYSQLEQLCNQASKMKRCIFNGGDWNAVVGQRMEGDVADALGTFGHGERNVRGQWLVDWATTHGLTIANTCFRKRFDQQWTHDNGINKRQIDFWLFKKCRKIGLENAEACDDITVGADHRTVRLEVVFRSKRKSAKRMKQKQEHRKPLWGWKPADPREYESQVDVALRVVTDRWQTESLEAQVERKCHDIENLLMEVARKCQLVEEEQKVDTEQLETKLKVLIKQRREARIGGKKEDAKALCKLIQREVRAIARAKKRARIGNILKEFRGLRDIADIRHGRKKARIASMKDQNGTIFTEQTDVANVFA
jgi:hypothetical protein